MGSLQVLRPDLIRIADIEAEVKAGIPEDQSRFMINETYQRSKVWKKGKEIALLDTILNDLSIGVLFFKKNENGKLEVLDGQQRINTIRKILQAKVLNLPGLKYLNDYGKFKEFKVGSVEYTHFLDFNIWFIPVVGGKDEEVSDLFLKLQEGLPLRPAEKLNALKSELKGFVIKQCEHQLFKRKEFQSRISPYRFRHRYLMAQTLYVMLESNWGKKGLPNPPREPQLRTTYERYRDMRVPKTLETRTTKVLNFLEESLGQDVKVIRSSDFVFVFVLAFAATKKYVVNREVFKEFVTIFFTEVEKAKVRETKSEIATPYQEYKELRKGGGTQRNYQRRLNILLKQFRKWKRLKRKDQDRFFTWAQKLEIYYEKNKGLCSNCGKHVDWKDASFDHVERHSKGGKTIVINGRLVHSRKCHAELEKRKKTRRVGKRSVTPIEMKAAEGAMKMLSDREDGKIERKSTLRFDLKLGQPSKVVEKSVAKTVVAFANAHGGTLFIGVDDNGNLLGLDPDFSLLKKPNTDGFEVELWQSLEKYLQDKIIDELVEVNFYKDLGKEVCMVRVSPSPRPIFLHDEGKEEPYVRVGNSSKPYTTAEFIDYSRRRFR